MKLLRQTLVCAIIGTAVGAVDKVSEKANQWKGTQLEKDADSSTCQSLLDSTCSSKTNSGICQCISTYDLERSTEIFDSSQPIASAYTYTDDTIVPLAEAWANQINRELTASYFYMQLFNELYTRGYTTMASAFKEFAAEERTHAKELARYASLRGINLSSMKGDAPRYWDTIDVMALDKMIYEYFCDSQECVGHTSYTLLKVNGEGKLVQNTFDGLFVDSNLVKVDKIIKTVEIIEEGVYKRIAELANGRDLDIVTKVFLDDYLREGIDSVKKMKDLAKIHGRSNSGNLGAWIAEKNFS